MFVKKIPASRRFRYIVERLAGVSRSFFGVDFTSLEATYTKNINYAIPFPVYRRLCSHQPAAMAILVDFINVVSNVSKCENRYLSVSIEAKLASGEMDTSTRNSLTNAIVLEFICDVFGITVDSVMEGDDSLNTVRDGEDVKPCHYSALGFNVKMESSPHLSELGFCGIVCDEVEAAVITDPTKVLLNVGLADARYLTASTQIKRELLRAKGFSLVHQYPGSPILQSLGLCLIRNTEGTDMEKYLERRIHYTDSYSYERMKELLSSQEELPVRPVGPNTRQLMYEKFGYSLVTQESLESFFDSFTGDLLKAQLPVALFEQQLLPEYQHYFDHYSIYGYTPKELIKDQLVVFDECPYSKAEFMERYVGGPDLPESQEFLSTVVVPSQVVFNPCGLTFAGDESKGRELYRKEVEAIKTRA
jgi:hypothetical protein